MNPNRLKMCGAGAETLEGGEGGKREGGEGGAKVRWGEGEGVTGTTEKSVTWCSMQRQGEETRTVTSCASCGMAQ